MAHNNGFSELESSFMRLQACYWTEMSDNTRDIRQRERFQEQRMDSRLKNPAGVLTVLALQPWKANKAERAPPGRLLFVAAWNALQRDRQKLLPVFGYLRRPLQGGFVLRTPTLGRRMARQPWAYLYGPVGVVGLRSLLIETGCPFVFGKDPRRNRWTPTGPVSLRSA